MKIYYPNFKTKALTFSYDDGSYQDEKLVEIFRKYNLTGTFNLNSSFMGKKGELNHAGFTIGFDKLAFSDMPKVYDGFEIASHGVTHANFTKLSLNELKTEVYDDITALEKYCKNKIIGLAYPCGFYDDATVLKLKELNIEYARTIDDTYTFNLPENFLTWHPTCHDNYDKIFDLIGHFKSDNSDTLKLFYIWGHSFEFDKNDKDRWSNMDNICRELSGLDDVWYATNGEICEYIISSKKLMSGGINNSNFNIYIEADGYKKTIMPNEKI